MRGKINILDLLKLAIALFICGPFFVGILIVLLFICAMVLVFATLAWTLLIDFAFDSELTYKTETMLCENFAEDEYHCKRNLTLSTILKEE